MLRDSTRSPSARRRRPNGARSDARMSPFSFRMAGMANVGCPVQRRQFTAQLNCKQRAATFRESRSTISSDEFGKVRTMRWPPPPRGPSAVRELRSLAEKVGRYFLTCLARAAHLPARDPSKGSAVQRVQRSLAKNVGLYLPAFLASAPHLPARRPLQRASLQSRSAHLPKTSDYIFRHSASAGHLGPATPSTTLLRSCSDQLPRT
jgi:hypothetical protein